MPRSQAEKEAIRTGMTVNKALNEVLRSVPITARARSGALSIASTSGPDTNAPIDEAGNPIEPTEFFRAGMRMGSARMGRR
jgi:hypothetical protein